MPDHWNRAEKLPPVGCPLLIRMPGGWVLKVERTAHVYARGDVMEYVTVDNFIILGKFEWTYP